ncbi:MAG: aldo/keto reductase [Desulfobacterales bacterium]
MLKKRKLGGQGLTVSELGLGCMGMSQSYGVADDRESIATIHRAIDFGVTFFDTAEAYGPYTNEELLGCGLRGRPDKVIIATKFGFLFEKGKIVGLDSRPEHIREVAESALFRLETDVIGLVPFSPLGRGFLTGTANRAEAYSEDDFRLGDPRFQGAHFDANMRATAIVRELAERKGATPGQVALAWLLNKGGDIVPIPGTKRRRYLEENVAAASLVLSAAEIERLDAALPPGATAGPRYNERMMAFVDR